VQRPWLHDTFSNLHAEPTHLTSNLQRQFRLASDVYACRAGGHVVILDLRRDQYLGFNASDAEGLEDLIDGWPTGLPDRSAGGASGAQLLDELRGLGLIDARGGFPASYRSPDIMKAATPLLDGYGDEDCTVGAIDAWHTLRASLTAAALLRWRGLDKIVTRARRRRLAAERSGFPQRFPSDRIDHVRAKVSAFFRLRPFFVTNQNPCLFDAIALGEFLAAYGVFPTWVFGVRVNPFAAHCWLQEGDVVLTDTPDNVGEFTPILVA
jgi:hypothetical protein